MKKLLPVLFLFFSFNSFCQKETTEVIDASGIEEVMLHSDEIYRIKVATAPVDRITIKTRTDGEYFNNISLDTEVKDNKLILDSRYRQILADGFDKLSAHKVFAMEVELEIPEGMRLEIDSNVASAFLKGDFEAVLVELTSGSAYLQDFTGNAIINTYDGNITIDSSEFARIEADSRHGKIEIPGKNGGPHLLKLSSINGDIKVK